MTPDQQKAVVLQNVSYQYPNATVYALKDLTVSIDYGEIVAVMGRTGSGKTTMLSLLNGLIPDFYEGHFTGSVVVDGLDTAKYKTHDLVASVGFVFQDAEMQIMGTTIEHDIAIGPCNMGMEPRVVRENVLAAAQSVKLTGMEQRSTAHLSGGEKQRVALAGVLAMKPHVLVLDEPTSELDPDGRKQFFMLLGKLSEQGYTIIVATHDCEEVVEIADRVLVLEGGSLKFDGTPSQLYSNIQQCKEFGLRTPAVTELFDQQDSGNHGVPVLTVDDAFDIVSEFRLHEKIVPLGGTEQQQQLPAGQTMIEINDLHHKYDSTLEALRGVQCTIREGEFVAIVGSNGAGKTTLSKHLNGLLKPSSGSVIVDGIDTRSATVASLSKIVGYVFQNPDHQIFSASVCEEIEFGLRQVGRYTSQEISERVKRAMALVGLEDAAKRHPFTLGKGERQKLAIASILAIEPKVLVIDEPTTGLDWAGTVRMMELIHTLHRQRCTIIIITHDLQLTAEHAQRVLVMSSGKLIADGTPDNVFFMTEILSAASLTMPPMAELSLRLRSMGLQMGYTRIADMKNLLSSLGRKGILNVN
jgi:energy-coupling factor transport system ATP-binding protein